METPATGGRIQAGDLLELAGLISRYAAGLHRRGLLRGRDLRLGFAAATARAALRNLLGPGSGSDAPEIATLAVTPRCPLDCRHCSAGARRGEPLPREAVLGTVDALQRMGTSIVAYTGGEPFLCEHLAEYVERVRPPAGALIYSSGWKLDEDVLRRLSGRPNLLVSVSLDHLDPEAHDRLRGRAGSHARALEGLELLARHGIPREVSTLVTGERIRGGELERFLAELRRRGVDSVQIFQPRPVGRLAAGDAELLAPAEEEWMAGLARRSFEDPRLPLVLNYPYVESAGVLGCCGGTYRLYVDARGEVCPCDFCPVTYGNVKEEPLERIWRRMRGHLGRPGRECLARAGRKAFAGLEDGAKLAFGGLPERGGAASGRAAHVHERYGDAGYRFLLKYMYFTSSMFPRVDGGSGGEG